MQITDTSGTVFEKVVIDIVGLKITKDGNEYILTMQNQLSKYYLAVPLSDAKIITIADALVKRLICIFGSSKVILSNQRKILFGQLIICVSKRFRVKRIKTTVFHPESNDSLKRSHHALSEFLKQYTDKDCE